MEPQKTIFVPTLQSYVLGYAVAVLLTLAAFGLAYLHIVSDHQTFSHEFLRGIIIFLAVLQLAAQSIFFLHLSLRSDQRANLITFIFMISIVVIIAGGSLWVLRNLNNNMSPEQISKYMQNED